jgi:hypothetical protein
MALNAMFGPIPEDERLAFVAEKILDRIFTEAMKLLWQNLDQKSLRNSDKLYNSIHKQLYAKKQDEIVEAVLGMDLSGVFHDMKTMKYTGRPPINSMGGQIKWNMEEMVRRGMPGGGRKAGPYPYYAVPGYKNVSQPTTEVHIKRIAAAVAYSKVREPVVRRAGGPWLSEVVKRKILEPLSDELTNAAHEFINARTKEWWKDFAETKLK